MNPSLQAELDRTLAGVLDEMRLAVAQLNETLDAEQDAIRGPDVAALDQAGTRKQLLMQQLEQLDAERVQLVRHVPDAAALEPAWQAVLRSLRTCRELNQRNGSVVGQRLGEVRRALAILTGHSADAGVYGRSGVLHAPSRSKTLAEA